MHCSVSARPTPDPRAFLSTSSRRNFATFVGRPDKKDRAHRLAADLGDPAMLARRVVRPDELRRDLGGQRLEADVPAIFLRIQRAVARNHPADVAGAMASQQEAGGPRRWRLQRVLDGGHGTDDGGALGRLEVARATPRLRCATGCRGRQRPRGLSRSRLSSVTRRSALDGFRATIWRRCNACKVRLRKPASRPSAPHQFGRGAALPFGDFVDDPRFLQRPGTVQQLRLDDAEFAGVEPAEAADGGNLAVEQGIWQLYLISSSYYLTKSSILQPFTRPRSGCATACARSGRVAAAIGPRSGARPARNRRAGRNGPARSAIPGRPTGPAIIRPKNLKPSRSRVSA